MKWNTSYLTFVLTSFVLSLHGCGQPEKLVVERGQASGSLDQQEKQCLTREGFRVYHFSKQPVNWQAIKLETKPVSGFLIADGWLALQGKPPHVLEGATGKITFDASSLDSFDQLRDDRIKKYILKSGVNRLAFHLEGIELSDQSQVMPSEGVSLEAHLLGSLEIAGLDWPITIPALVTATTKGFRIENSRDEPFQLNLRQDEMMASQVTELLDVASVASMEDEVGIGINVQFDDPCEYATDETLEESKEDESQRKSRPRKKS